MLERTAVFLSNDSGDVENVFSEIRGMLGSPPLVEGSLQNSKISAEFESTVAAFVDKINAL